VADSEDVDTVASSSRLPPSGSRGGSERRAPSPTSSPTATGSQSTAAPTGGSTTIGSPVEALERDEILRTRRFCIIAVFISIGAIGALPFVHAESGPTKMLAGAVIASQFAIAFLWWRTRDPIAFRKPSTGLGWFVPAVGVTTALPVFGAFSPAPVVLVLGVYFTGLGKSGRLAAMVYATCAGMQGLVGGLVIAGLHDNGMVHVDNLGVRDRVVIQLLVQLVLLATFVTARISRRTALVAVGELERAVRVAAHREALLLEAREELERALRPGRGRFSEQTIAGYQLGTLLGRGAMGEVYEAQGPRGVVAIKLLSQTSLGNPQHVLRFLRELRTAAAIDSPNVVRVFEVGEQPVPFLVMERLDGPTLAELLRHKRNLDAMAIVDLVHQLGTGVTAAGAAGIVHRDLKPQNVIRQGSTYKILDFGVARAVDGGDTLTAGQIVGTPSYMAPEQAASGNVDHRSDLYAVAAIAYRAFTGQPPFAAGEIAETLYKVVHTAPRRPSELTELPREVDLVLAIGLAKSPDARFQRASELATALADAFTGHVSDDVRRRGEALDRGGAWRPPLPRFRR
jgi:eukaryotic-like serine/threonine-protein kinase